MITKKKSEQPEGEVLTRAEKKQLKKEKKQIKKNEKKTEKNKKKGIIEQLPKEEEVLDLFSTDRKGVKVLCSPDGVNPNPCGYMVVNDDGRDIYVCNMYIDKLPGSSAFAETFVPLFNYPNVTAKVDINEMGQAEASRMLDKRIIALESELYAAEKQGDRNRHRKIQAKMGECEGWASAIESGENVLFSVGFLFSLYAETLEEMNDTCNDFHMRAKEKGIDVIATYSVHPEAYLSNAPTTDMMSIGVGPIKDNVIKYHIMDKYSLSTIYNHTQGSFRHRNGILAGRSLDTFRPILVDPYDHSHDAYNMLVCGTTGVGKSATIKMWSSRYMEVFGYKFAAIDFDSPDGFEGEYVPLVRAHGGAVYQIKHGTDNILNPFDVNEEINWNKKLRKEVRELNLDQKIEDCTNIALTQIKNGKEINDFDTDTFLKEIVSAAIREMYEEKGMRDGNPDSIYEQSQVLVNGKLTAGKQRKLMPTMSELFIKLLIKQKLNKSRFHELAYAIAISGLAPYVKQVIYSENSITTFSDEEYRTMSVDGQGEKYTLVNSERERVKKVRGYKPYFDGQSTVSVTAETKSIDIDLSQLPEGDRNVAQQVACNFINENFVKKNSNNPNKLQKLIFLIDEFHRTFDYKSARDFISSLYRQVRKRYVVMCTVTQALTDYDRYEETRAIVKNSSMKILFKQDIMDTEYIQKVTPLTNAQISRVTQLGGSKGDDKQFDDRRKGECCLIDNNDKVVFMKVDYLTASEAKICETDPSKIAKMMQNSRRTA